MDKFQPSDLALGLNADTNADPLSLESLGLTTGTTFDLDDLGLGRAAIADRVTVRADHFIDDVDDRTPTAILRYIDRVDAYVNRTTSAPARGANAHVGSLVTPRTSVATTTPTQPRIPSGRQTEDLDAYFRRNADADAPNRAVAVTRFIDLVADFYAPRTRSETARAPRVMPSASGFERLVSGPNRNVIDYLERELDRADANYDAAVMAQLRELKRLIEGKRSEPNRRARGSYNRYLRRVITKLGALGLTVDDILNRLNANG